MTTDNIKDGDYIYTPVFKGVYSDGGIIPDFGSSSDDLDMYDEWKNKILRESIAKSSLIKIRRIKNKYYFTKGKLYEVGLFLKENNIDSVFINAELSSL